MTKFISIIGCGKVGKTLSRLWTLNGALHIQDILNRSVDSATRASAFIGAGRAIASYADLQPADIYLIAAPDDQIEHCCEELSRTGNLSADSIVFHCSGALPSSVLQAACQQGAAVASIHPIRSFASPEKVIQSFTGTFCGMEGDQRALDVLQQAFTAIGAQLVSIKADAKILYHAAAVFSSNYLVTLLDVAQQAYIQAGIAPDVALKLIEPLMRETADNVFRLGTEAALTGPIARGDMATAEKQLRAVAQWNPACAALYEQFMKLTVDLAARRDNCKN
ncbi:MAG TPA: Rossmann-like and DUF2520 domain-containing protein [Burkholderiaceae bacterium]|jgi:predicted short-subunit dehydrogenase-like oxidoreductase (DUF2520 family)